VYVGAKFILVATLNAGKLTVTSFVTVTLVGPDGESDPAHPLNIASGKNAMMRIFLNIWMTWSDLATTSGGGGGEKMRAAVCCLSAGAGYWSWRVSLCVRRLKLDWPEVFGGIL
jgi:hypothetical protein